MYVCMYSSQNFSFYRLSRPPKGWQERKTEKANGPKIPKNPKYSKIPKNPKYSKILEEKFGMCGIEDVCLKAEHTLNINKLSGYGVASIRRLLKTIGLL